MFSSVKENVIRLNEQDHVACFLQLENAHVRWDLSIDKNDIAKTMRNSQ